MNFRGILLFSIEEFSARAVKKPFLGTVQLNVDLCPEGCMAYVNICPTHAAQLNENGKPKVQLDFCVYCFACEKVCPENAVKVKRNWIFHSDVRCARASSTGCLRFFV